MCLNTDSSVQKSSSAAGTLYISHLPSVSYFEAPLGRNTQTNAIPCIVLLRPSLLTETFPPQEQKDTRGHYKIT